MELILDYRWEHALVASTIEAAQKNAASGLGRTALQKFLYFLKVLGVPMNYTFEIHHDGPFCQTVMSDVDWLREERVVVDAAVDPSGSDYRTGPAWGELQIRFRDALAAHCDAIDAVCEALAGWTTRELELISTLDFCFRWVRAAGGPGPWRDRAIAKFREAKKSKFSEDEIRDWYDRLSAAKLIDP